MDIKMFLIMGLLSIFGMSSCANTQKQENEVTTKLHYTMNEGLPKNYYLLTMSSNGCNFRVLVNDVPVFGYWDTGAYTGSNPINHFILKSGTQKLKVELYPVYQYEDLGINSEEPLYLEIKKGLNEQDLDDYVAVLTNPIPKVEKGIPYYEYECTFDAEVPYEITELDDLVDLTKEPNIEEQVVAKYNELKELYENRKYLDFQSKFSLKYQRIDITNYITKEESSKESEDNLEQMKKKFKKVAPIENYELKFYANNKLAMLLSKEDCTYAFRLDDGGDDMWALPFYLGKRKGSDKLEFVF